MELLDAFDVTVSYDKPRRRLDMSAAIESNLLADDVPATPAGRARSQGSDIAGAGFGHNPATRYRFVELRMLP